MSDISVTCVASNVEQRLTNPTITCNSGSTGIKETTNTIHSISKGSINTKYGVINKVNEVSKKLSFKKNSSDKNVSDIDITIASTPIRRPSQIASLWSHSDSSRNVNQISQLSDNAVAEDVPQAVNNAEKDQLYSDDCFITGEDLNTSPDTLLHSALALNTTINQLIDTDKPQSNKTSMSTGGIEVAFRDSTVRTNEDSFEVSDLHDPHRLNVMAARNLHKVRENPGAHSFTKTRNIGESLDRQGCSGKDSQTDQTPPCEDEPLKLPSKSAEISSVLPVRQGAGEASGSVEHSDSSFTSSTQISSTMINCFVSLEKLSELDKQLAISTDSDTIVTVHSLITSPLNNSATRTLSQTSTERNKTGPKTDRLNNAVTSSLEETTRASHRSSLRSKCLFVNNSKSKKSNRIKYQRNSQTNDQTSVTPCKNAVGIRKADREEGQNLEMDSQGEVTVP
ncbi:hypothetical protein ElyMa_002367500 [Elysia marginata]|uniref:Uncharacterized protein n=1 Tax=Elysia marginata TaxID=1093978 RepID=A0AAV4GAI2_9GAST|nr:hypothetical protein ElyMa_002367500 [Elysia marginata]